MREVTKYQCALCNTVYNDKVDAMACENSHKIPIKIDSFKFSANKKYPESIEVSAADGRKLTYFITGLDKYSHE